MLLKEKKPQMLILCGGRGKRMGKITNAIPKPLIRVGNQSIIEHKIRYYKSQGIKQFIFCLGYKSKKLKSFLQRKIPKSMYSDAGVNAGILKRIFFAKKFMKGNTIISYGDTLAKINLKNLIKNHIESKCLMTIVVAPIQNPFGLVNWDIKNKATSFKEKPFLNHYIGYAVVSPDIFDQIDKRIINLKDGMGIVRAIKNLILKKQVNIYKFNKLQVTINSPEELKHARLNYKKYFTF